MASLTFALADADLARYVAACASAYGYQDVLDGKPNPETKGQFAKRMIQRFMVDTVKSVELAEARRTVTVAEIAVA